MVEAISAKAMEPVRPTLLSNSPNRWTLIIGKVSGRILAGCAVLASVAVVMLVIFMFNRGQGGSTAKIEKAGPLPSVQEKKSIPSQGTPNSSSELRPIQPSKPNVATTLPSVPPTKPAAKISDQQNVPTNRMLAESLPTLELPPIGPTKPSLFDQIAQNYKIIRKSCEEARHNARSKLRAELHAQFLRLRDEIQQGKSDNQEKSRSLQQLGDEMRKLAYSPSHDGGGPIPTHPLMRESVKKYVQTMKDAYQEQGTAAEKALADYEKAGTAEPPLLRPLLAASLAGKCADFLGVWETENLSPPSDPINARSGRPAQSSKSATRPKVLSAPSPHQCWVVEIDEDAGGLQIGCVVENAQGFLGGHQVFGIYHADRIEYKDGVLNFVATQEDKKATTSKRGGNPTTLSLKADKLQYKSKSDSMPSATALVRTDAIHRSQDLALRQKKNPILDRSTPTSDPIDVVDANAVWHRVAQLTSFAYYQSNSWTPLEHEALYLPYRQDHPTNLPGLGGGMYNLLTGAPTAATADRDQNAALINQFELLAAAPHPYLKQTIEAATVLCHKRLRIAMANEQLGNTGASQIQLADGMFMAGLKYGLQRDADILELQERVQRGLPYGYIATVTDAPLSEESKQRLAEFLNNVGSFHETIRQRTVVTGLLSYADMIQVDRSAEFWKTWLIPLARRCAGPVSVKPLIQIEGSWGRRPLTEDLFQRLSFFQANNVAGEDLTHVVVELIAENEWGDKESHYYYFDRLDGAEFVRLVPNPRMVKRRLPFTNNITVTWSLWSDQGCEIGRQVKLTNPQPDPESTTLRDNYINQDRLHQGTGEALGILMQGVIPLPLPPERKSRVLREAVMPGKTYVFFLQGERKRTMVLRFRSFDQNQNTFEAELFDADTKEPLKPETVIWKGKMSALGEKGQSFRVDSANQDRWEITLSFDQQPEIFCSAGGTPGALFPVREIPLYPIRSP